MLVVDANVVAYLLIDGDKTAQARELWHTDSGWCAPRLLFYELASVFSQLVRQGALSIEHARAGLESGLSLVRLLDKDPDPGRVLEIVQELSLSVYDACYLATAEMMQVPLFTEDARLLRAAPQVARSPAQA